MATFTMTLSELLESVTDIGLDSYPIFDEKYRAQLNQKIVDHYLNQEIAHDTPEMFRHRMRSVMNTIMPYYNQLYLSTRLEIDPLKTLDMTQVVKSITDATGDTESSGDSTQDVASKARSIDMTTPQNQLHNTEDYASGAQDSLGETKTSGTAKDNAKSKSVSDTDSTQRSTGYSGSQAELLTRYRQTFINIDEAIVDHPKIVDLFMQVWANGDSATTKERNAYVYGIYGFTGLYGWG